MDEKRIAVTQSWALASLLIRRHPELRLCEKASEAEQRGYLTLIHDGASVIAIDPTCGAVIPSDQAFAPMQLGSIFDERQGRTLLKALSVLELAAKLGPPQNTPVSTTNELVTLLIASLLSATQGYKDLWEVRNEVQHTADRGMQLRGYLAAFSGTVANPQNAQRPRLNLMHPNQRYWAVLREGEPVALLDIDGYAHIGERRLHLYPLYESLNRRLSDTLGAIFHPLLDRWRNVPRLREAAMSHDENRRDDPTPPTNGGAPQ